MKKQGIVRNNISWKVASFSRFSRHERLQENMSIRPVDSNFMTAIDAMRYITGSKYDFVTQGGMMIQFVK